MSSRIQRSAFRDQRLHDDRIGSTGNARLAARRLGYHHLIQVDLGSSTNGRARNPGPHYGA
jgi:hypothetical protein